MYQLTQEFIEEYLGDRYEALFAVYVDKGHLHSHIVFNSVSMIDGYKYQYTKGDWKNIIQPITNSLCEKYGWSVI
ncbi:relaxase/mobilization nuclease domain-containing protein, partial [Acinetobacter baumannii]|uniref:relaxase/mobilization nuclease domain-containing protein n=1 Tax=Acinetobacter baumannii TaxID=470 RepID=UPI003330952B